MTPAPYALLPRLDAVVRPIVFPDLPALAAHIHRARAGQALDMTEVQDLHHQWHVEGGGAGVDMPSAPDRGVQVWTQDLSGARDLLIGWAWLDGGGLERLRDALAKAETTPRLRDRGLIADDSAYRSRVRRAAIVGAPDHFGLATKVA